MDHVVVVSLIVKANSLKDAKDETIMNLNKWFNDPDTWRFKAIDPDDFSQGGTQENLIGALLHYTVLDKSFSVVTIDGTPFCNEMEGR